MRSSLKKNYIYNLIYQVLILFFPFITAPYISRVLGAENIGIYSYTTSITAYFILFGSLGVALYGKREIAFVQNDKEKYTKLFYEILFFRLITMIISIIIFYLFFCINNEYGIFYKILIIELIANILDISWFFQGLEQFKKLVAKNLIVKVLSVISIFFFVKNTNQLINYFIIYSISIILGNISMWFYLPNLLSKINLGKLNIFKHLKPNLVLFIPQIAVQIYTVLDKTMIGIIIENKSEVGYYQQAQRIIKLILTLTTATSTVMLPRIASSFAQGANEKIKKYLEKSFCLTFLLALPIVFGIILIADKFVPLFFGPGYDKVSILMIVICPIILFIGLSSVIGNQYLLPTKRQKEYTISIIFGAVINLFFNLIFIPRLGAIGASIGTVIAELMVALIQLIMARNLLNIKRLGFLFLKYFIASFIMFILLIPIKLMVHNNFMSIMLCFIFGAGIYFICLKIMKDEFFNYVINILTSKFKRIKKR